MNKPHPTLQSLTKITPPSKRVDRGVRLQNFKAGSVLFKAGEPRDNAYLIEKGTVDILGPGPEGPQSLLARLSPGDVFGEMALIDGGLRSAAAVVTSDAELFVIPRGALRDRVRDMDPILSLMLALLVERYRTVRVNLPESIRQDQISNMAQAMDRAAHYDMPEDAARLSELWRQRDNAIKELKLEQELRRGIEKGEFVPALQPIVALPSRRLVGFETLVRWNHPERGMVFPDEFIPVAERTNLVQFIDHMMLQKACELMPDLLSDMGGDDVPLFISANLSGINFENLDIIQSVRETLVHSGVDPHRIKLEITESALIDDPEKTEQVLRGLRALGVTIALDDFGTGYSSLGYLHRFPIDSIKVDRSFVSQMHDAPRSIDIIRAIVGLAHNFKMDVVAEGLETEQDVQMINALGCEMAQGYFFAKPLMPAQAREFAQGFAVRKPI
ncbi:EAL domain-containing protein [Micavibrio aeruginosavorus]|uniref:EAL domain-containing protein n=1 Tax=Micavibrio aeruginosavorus TaxID=349221 RepID=UPI003F4AEE56